MIDLLAPEVFRSYSARPERLLEVIKGSKSKTIIIDEVQKVPELLDVVHGLVEDVLDHFQEIDGAGLEGLVAQHLRVWIAYGNKNCNLSYWRTKSGVEVDFILYGEDTFMVIEVKNSARINRKMINGLTAFKQDYPEAQAFLLYQGSEQRLINNILCLLCEQFLRDLIPGQPIGRLMAG
jgi:predicted AAA+ superfamily ATPase